MRVITMVKRGPKVDPDNRLKRRLVEEIFEKFPSGLSVRDTVKEAGKRRILSSPNKVLKLLRELYAEGVLDFRMTKVGRGPPRKIYTLSLSARVQTVPSEIKIDFDRRRKVLSLGIEELIEELRRSPARYWTMRVLEAAEAAGVIEQLKDDRDKMDFFRKLENNIGKRGAGASMSLLRLTDVSFALIQSILTYAFLQETTIQHGLVDGERFDLVKGIELACEKTSDDWTRLIKKGIKTFLFSQVQGK